MEDTFVNIYLFFKVTELPFKVTGLQEPIPAIVGQMRPQTACNSITWSFMNEIENQTKLSKVLFKKKGVYVCVQNPEGKFHL